MIRQVRSRHELRDVLTPFHQSNKSIGLVPTMGNLHAGHLALVRHARDAADVVVVSIFVNPMQFDRADDLRSYPRTLEEDARQLEALGVDLLFVPQVAELYPADMASITRVEVPGISERLEGAARAGHFSGVATVVAKLFHLVQPDIAVFGEKDYQQLAVIRKMVVDLNFSVEVLSIPTVREPSGLAMSSRNTTLSDDQRRQAAELSRILNHVVELIQSNDHNFREIEEKGAEMLRKTGFKPDYLEICQSETLLPANDDDRSLVVLAAAWLGPARLIDNLTVQLKTTR